MSDPDDIARVWLDELSAIAGRDGVGAALRAAAATIAFYHRHSSKGMLRRQDLLLVMPGTKGGQTTEEQDTPDRQL